MKQLDVAPCCVTCRHFETIQKGKLYRCHAYAFQQVTAGKCPKREPWTNGKRTEKP